jgi:hypothetical protein
VYHHGVLITVGRGISDSVLVAHLELHYELVPEKLVNPGLLRDGGEPLVQ